jgi:hypothetical protein
MFRYRQVAVILLLAIPEVACADFWSDLRDDTIGDPIGLIVNPMAPLNVFGVPTPGDLTEHVIKNPRDIERIIKNPEDLIGAPLATAIVSARNRAHSSGTSRIPPHVRQQLLPYFPQSVLDSVVWNTSWGALNGLPQYVAIGCAGANAVALIDVIVFRSVDMAHSPVLWAHELTHIVQYRSWGLPKFARRYTVDHNGVENEAYREEGRIRSLLAQNNQMPNAGIPVAPGWFPPPPARACVLPGGSCPLMGPLPRGAYCQCFDNWGRPYQGTAM